MTTTVYLIRHGETDWNVSGRWQGHADVPLNDIGRKQAELLAQRLQNEGVVFHSIYSSDLARAYQTAWQLGAAVKVPVQLLPALREIDLGYWSGLTRDEVRAQYPVEYALLEQGQDIPRGGAETLSALRKRVVEAVSAIIAQHVGRTLAMVSHGGPVRMLLAHAAQNGAKSEEFHHIGNTSISIIRCNGDQWELLSYNDMHHLADIRQAPDLMSAPPDDAEQPEEWNP